MDERKPGVFRAVRIGPLGKFFLAVLAVAFVVVGFMFSVVLLVAVAVLGVLIWGFVWWKTRPLRRGAAREPRE